MSSRQPLPMGALNQHQEPAYGQGAVLLILSIATILTALGFEHLGGYRPCELCLMQRWAYYTGIPLTFVALAFYATEQRALAAFLLGLVALAFLGNAGLGVYHAGAEWHFWPGPDTCGGTLGKLSLNVLGKERIIRCDEAPWRALGLSFAGWNVVISLILSSMAARAAGSAASPAAP